MPTIAMTYDKVSEESAREGDTCENGFVLPGGWEFPLNDSGTAKDVDKNPEFYWVPVKAGDVRSAVQWAAEHECVRDNGDGSFYSVDSNIDYRTGIETNYAIHFNGFKARALRIIAAELGC